MVTKDWGLITHLFLVDENDHILTSNELLHPYHICEFDQVTFEPGEVVIPERFLKDLFNAEC